MARTSFGFVRPIQPLKSFKRHILSASITLVVFSLVAVIAAWYTKPLYEAKALVYISEFQNSNLMGTSDQAIPNYQSYVQNQIYIMYSYEVLKDAILRLGDNAKMWDKAKGWKSVIFFWKRGGGEDAAVENLKNSLIIERMEKSNMIGISLQGDKAEGLAETVNAVADAYLFRVRGEGIEGKDERVTNLTRRRRELYARLRDLSAQKAKVAESLGIAATDMDVEEDPFRQQIEALHIAIYDAGVSNARQQAAFEALKSTTSSYTKEDLEKMADMEAEQNELLSNTYSALLEQRVALQSVVNNMKPSHPKRKRLEDELKMREEEYKNLRKRIVSDSMGKIKRQISAKLDEARFAAEEAKQLEIELKGKMAKMLERLQKYNTLYDEAAKIKVEMDRVSEQLVTIDNKLDMFATEENAPGMIEISSYARYPEVPDHKNRLKVFIAIFVVGLLVGIGIPSLLDAFNPWVMTPSDVYLAVKNPPLGCILEHGDAQYRELARDQLRRLALAINAKARKDNLLHFEFTSAKAGGGSSELSFLLCNELLHIGVKPLLVEANIFKPDLRYEGLEYPGFIDILRDNVPVRKCIIPADPEKYLPDRIRAGNIKGESLLPTKADWSEHYKQISGEYDIVIYDTPPVLLSADAEMMSRFCDATLLVIEAEGVTFFEMIRALNAVKPIAENIGIVMNRAVVYPESGYYKDLLEEYGGGAKHKNGIISRLLLREGRKREVRKRGEYGFSEVPDLEESMIAEEKALAQEDSTAFQKKQQEKKGSNDEPESVEIIDIDV